MCNTCNCDQCNDCKDTPRKNTPDEMIEVITAIKEGKPLEYRAAENLHSRWERRHKAQEREPPNFATYQYRVKQIPIEIWCRVDNQGTVHNYGSSKASEKAAQCAAKDFGGHAAKFIEVKHVAHCTR